MVKRRRGGKSKIKLREQRIRAIAKKIPGVIALRLGGKLQLVDLRKHVLYAGDYSSKRIYIDKRTPRHLWKPRAAHEAWEREFERKGFTREEAHRAANRVGRAVFGSRQAEDTKNAWTIFESYKRQGKDIYGKRWW